MKHLETIKQTLLVITMIFLAITAKAQDNAQDDEPIRINTSVGQISVAIEQTVPEPFKIEVTDNGMPMENVKWDSPATDNPLQMIIVVAMNPVGKWKTNKDDLLYEIKKLRENSGINLLGVSVANDAEGFGNSLKFPKSVNVTQFDNLNAAVNNSVSVLQATKKSRQAILLLTNEVESLPVDIIERTNEMLGQSSLMVYMMSINANGLKNYQNRCKKKCKIIAQSNINGEDLMIFPRNLLSGLFRSFTRLATHVYTVSYDLQESENHHIEAVVKRISDSRAITKNIRSFKALPTGDAAVFNKIAFRTDNKKSSEEETAVKDVVNSDFNILLKKRATKLTSDQVKFYEQELRNRPEMSGVEILPEDGSIVQNLSRNLAPVMKFYDRDNYTKFFVYKGDNPFIGLYRESIIIFSTKALDLLSEEQLRAAVAHELAHEIFIDEMRAADKSDSNGLRHIVEHKCDLVAVMVTSQLKDDPFAVVNASEIFTKFYKENPPKTDIGVDKSPLNAARKDCIKSFLKALTKNII